MYGDTSAGQRRQDSRKRRRVSERRRAFSRLGGLNSGESITLASASSSSSTTHFGASSATATTGGRRSSRAGALKSSFRTMDLEDTNNISNTYARRSDSPSSITPFNTAGDQSKISMKIQFHITPVAQDTEPLILDTIPLLAGPAFEGMPPPPTVSGDNQQQDEGRRASGVAAGSNGTRKKSTSESVSIGDHIHERLMSRQNTLSTRRRQQLLALHNQAAMAEDQTASNNRQRERLASITGAADDTAKLNGGGGGREAGARSSTITGGMQDEATMRFLARHQHNQRHHPIGSDTLNGGGGGSSSSSRAASLGGAGVGGGGGRRFGSQEREHIFFKRDGQRFGHEFTLKLAVDKNYRCLLKVRPLIPLQAISIQGHHVSFVDCSLQPGALVGSLSSSAPSIVGHSAAGSSSTTPLGSSWQSINTTTARYQNGTSTATDLSSSQYNTKTPPNNHLISNHHIRTSQPEHHRTNHHHRLSHAQTTAINPIKHQQQHLIDHRRVSSAVTGATDSASPHPHPQAYSLTFNNSTRQLQLQLLKQQQHNQMMRHFAASHCSPSGSHLGSQLVYMFDWSASRFEVNKNKARTQIQTVLKFKNGEILSLPLQVKFYQSESRQHLNWGSQLHFIDYDCNINNMGQINVERIQYY